MTEEYRLGEKLVEVRAAAETHREVSGAIRWSGGDCVVLGAANHSLGHSPLETRDSTDLGGFRGSE